MAVIVAQRVIVALVTKNWHIELVIIVLVHTIKFMIVSINVKK